MKYADSFKDLPLDSAELATDCRKAAVHLPSEIQQFSTSRVLKQSQLYTVCDYIHTDIHTYTYIYSI